MNKKKSPEKERFYQNSFQLPTR